ncbi:MULTISPECIES: F0F1 ATP synthase subunit alpha [Faecalibacterium]|jgi:F-type H+-transporting ATPase subunit alpha|uniref:F0F1 ATP synthase subunit alpha n=1 Tax=Faecalibacterium langellae TaxID=3435293 RepID=A0ACC9CWG7_9FIRM|nr:F0F1 ATP synthase subunit alpha [Faecalibacterium prausnitzii]MDU8691573.1 F0F1 ATP synthase subunit alpha [Faecalibacterium prausnitzii]PDX60190.1 F0F1 ATP synthase subunit alpha [Faecalibacterium prausnitzii]HAQ95966.1 F0F1 ATP synthase subunit alpha [Faecalibacterium sp.]
MASAAETLKAYLHSARTPSEQALERIRAQLKKQYGTDVELTVSVEPELLSGYVLQVGDKVIDNSAKHMLETITAGTPDLATMQTRAEDYKPAAEASEGGTVVSAADGVVEVKGMDKAVYGEIVTFDTGAKGMVESVEPDRLGVMLFDDIEKVGVGTLVTRSGKRAGIPVGDGFLGRVISPLGEPIDGKGPIESVGYNPIEKQAPGILERQSVDTPLHTGILAIDSMFPIGRGQRELIIGDRQTGKTSIATDAILNQKDTGVLCIYVAIGQKASSIARVAGDLQKHGAMSYTTIVAATASDSAPLQYIAPYAGTALAEYFMAQGKSVLIVYDDLSKHAVAYRAISLLLRRSPGREAYPGDVFYLHSRLLERSCRMRDDLGGGSITALPIVETQAGDVSAYIPTNVISITDGQIFLESALFNAGNRPAVNVGLSVSRVGGAAQTKAMKKANANLRIELAQYKDMESFAQFSSDLDAETRRQLDHGKALMEMLKQPLYQPKSDAEQVVTLVLASHGMLDSLPTAELRSKTSAFVRQFRADVSGTMDKITATGKLEPEMVDAILNAWKAYAGGDSHAVQ